MPDFYTMLGGFQAAQDKEQARTRAEADANLDRERAVYSALMQSDDPRLHHLALTGILDSANPKKKKGFAGWMGELEQSPAYAAIQREIQGPDFQPQPQRSLPSARVQGSMPDPGGPGTQGINAAAPENQPDASGALADQEPPVPTLLTRSDPAAPLAQSSTALTQQQGQAPPPQPTTLSPLDQQVRNPVGVSGQHMMDAAGAGPGDPVNQSALGIPSEAQAAVQQAQLQQQAQAMADLPRHAQGFVATNTPKVQTLGQDPLHGIGAATPPPIPAVTSRSQDPGGDPTGAMLPPKRRVFLDPLEKFKQEQIAKAGADIEGDVRAYMALGMPREHAIDQVKAERLRKAGGTAGSTYAEGEITPDPASPTGFSQTLYLRSNPAVTTKMPAMDPAKTNSRFFGQDLESISREPAFGGRPYAQQSPEMQQRINTEKQQREAHIAGARAGSAEAARGQAAADIPLSNQQRYQATTGLQEDWQKIQAPQREMERQLRLMEVGLRRFKAGDKNGGSQAILVTFQKVLDPTSVVRESEYARSADGIGLFSRLEGMFDKVKAGGAGVPEADLAAVVETARQFMANLTHWNDAQKQRINTTASSFRIDPALITGTPTAGTPPPSPRGAAVSAPTGTPPPMPNTGSGPAGIFVGADGQLHTGSPTGPLYQAGR